MSDWPKKAYWNTVSGILYLEPINKNCLPVLVYPADQAPKPVAWRWRDPVDGQVGSWRDMPVQQIKMDPGEVGFEYEYSYLAPPNAEQIRAEEREKCAKLCEALYTNRFRSVFGDDEHIDAQDYAAAIRSLK
jgi:hypothetical protein